MFRDPDTVNNFPAVCVWNKVKKVQYLSNSVPLSYSIYTLRLFRNHFKSDRSSKRLSRVMFDFLFVCFRVLWRKYRRRRECKQYDGVLRTEESMESVSQPLHTHLLNSDKVI